MLDGISQRYFMFYYSYLYDPIRTIRAGTEVIKGAIICVKDVLIDMAEVGKATYYHPKLN